MPRRTDKWSTTPSVLSDTRMLAPSGAKRMFLGEAYPSNSRTQRPVRRSMTRILSTVDFETAASRWSGSTAIVLFSM